MRTKRKVDTMKFRDSNFASPFFCHIGGGGSRGTGKAKHKVLESPAVEDGDHVKGALRPSKSNNPRCVI